MELVNSIVKAVRVLDLLKSRGEQSYAEILKQLSLPKSTLFKILLTLEETELVRRDQVSGRYHLGVKLIEWGSGARSQLEIRKIAQPFMQRLHESLDCTVHLTIVSHGEVLPIENLESGSATWPHYIFHGGIGIPAPLHATAAGKAMLAFMDHDKVRALISEKGLGKFTDNTITDAKVLHVALREIRRRGYAVSNAENTDMVRSVAAPIRDQEGQVFAALSVLGMISRIAEERIPEIAAQVVAAANEISRLFGYFDDGTAAHSSSVTQHA